MTQAIEIHNLSFSYEPQLPVLKVADLTIPRKTMTLLYGPSGSGKSTLLKILAGLLPKYGGQLDPGSEISLKATEAAMMFQDPSLQFAMDTPWHEAEFALENLQIPPVEMPARIQAAFATVEISHLAHRQFATLSGGEKQRAALAVIIAMQKPVILLDEPFASLDPVNRKRLLQQLQTQVEAGKTVIIADHDLSNYQAVNPNVIQFGTDHQTQVLTSQAVRQLLVAANQQPVIPAKPAAQFPAILTGTNLKITQPNQVLIDQAHFQLPANQISLLTGESGSGKSTLLKVLAKLGTYQGSLLYAGQELRKYSARRWGRKCGLVFQHAADQFLNVTVAEELALSQKQGRHPYFTPANLQNALTKLGLAALTDRVVYSLSGGQQKKLQILVMLMMGQPLLLLDEPFTGLDAKSAQAIRELIDACQATAPATILVVSHQLNGLADWVDCHFKLQNQHLVDRGEVLAWIPV